MKALITSKKATCRGLSIKLINLCKEVMKKFKNPSIMSRIEQDALENVIKEVYLKRPTPMVKLPKIIRTCLL